MDPQQLSNIDKICRIENDFHNSRTSAECFGDFVAKQAGKMTFIAFHAVWFAIWILLNARIVPGVLQFDPFPYQFLTFMVSLEAIFLSLFILMSQNRASRQADVRSHLDLQINLLSEQESTKTLQLLQLLCTHHGIGTGVDSELERLQVATQPEDLLRDLKTGMPNA